jgi:penicillin-binding protein 2
MRVPDAGGSSRLGGLARGGGLIGLASPAELAPAAALSRRRAILRWLVLALFAALAARLLQIQVIHGREYRRASDENRVRLIRREAARGAIYDRRGRILATSRLCLDVVVSPAGGALPVGLLQRPGAVEELARVLGTSPGEAAARLTREQGTSRRRVSFEDVIVAVDVPYDVAARAAEASLYLPGMRLEARLQRSYPRGSLAAHALGYVRDISAAELETMRDLGYSSCDRTGKEGIERVCETSLHGQSGGEQIEVDASGNLMRVLGQVPAVGGEAVTLNLDAAVQAVAERGLVGRSGAAVAMDVRSGEILALASSPTFNPNSLSGKITPAQWRYLSGRARPQQNRAATALYEPGSVMKLVTAAAAIETGHAAAGSRFVCPGYYQIGRWRFRCWQRGGHGTQDFISGIAHSCNVMFIRLGRSVGRPALERWARAFGLGAATGIDLPDENTGLVPTPRWKRRRFGLPWYPGDTCQISVGQGGLLVTPLQAVVVTAAIANGGYRVTPRLVRAVGSSSVASPAPVPVGVKPTTVALLRQGMAEVVRRGTARAVFDPSFPIAGKTGTAENPQGRPHAWFVGFAPVDHPQVAVAVVVEQGGSGAAVAPIGAALLRAACDALGGGVSAKPVRSLARAY